MASPTKHAQKANGLDILNPKGKEPFLDAFKADWPGVWGSIIDRVTDLYSSYGFNGEELKTRVDAFSKTATRNFGDELASFAATLSKRERDSLTRALEKSPRPIFSIADTYLRNLAAQEESKIAEEEFKRLKKARDENYWRSLPYQ